MNTKNLKDAWDKSYSLGQNNILYSQSELIKFINVL